MKRILGVLGGLLLIVGLLPLQNSSAATDTNNFRITSYNIQYELSRDSESRSVLKTTETITALFPSFDQNHGLERAIPNTYVGHSTSLDISKVTDENGNDIQYSTYANNGNEVLRIGDANSYVHGSKTYRITYEQRDITRFFGDNGRDEWYWDTNGTDWKVPIDTLSVSVSLDPSLLDEKEGAPSCYQGRVGSNGECSVVVNNGGTSYTIKASDLAAGDNVTVAFGFKQGTFAAYEESLFERVAIVWTLFQFLTLPIAAVLIIIMSIVWVRRIYRIQEQNPIVAEYIPPKDASLLVASQLMVTKRAVFTAQLIDLAIRRFISIVETRKKSLWRTAEYDIVILKDPQLLYEEEREIIKDMFGYMPKPDERLKLSQLKNNMGYSARTLDNDKKLKVLMNDRYGIKEESPKDTKFFYKWAVGVLVVAILTLSILLFVAAIVFFIFGYKLRRLSDKGLELRRYVLGLDKYIKASETERLAFLQGPDTAQKVGYDVDPNNPGQVVKLYERALPYAILFGREKEWTKRLGEFYDQSSTSPDWYTGTSVFNAAAFTSSIHSFSQASTYSSSSSSSSGGSSGGGFSGGGGGGGGGGGW